MKKMTWLASFLVVAGLIIGMVGCEWESITDEDAQLSKNSSTNNTTSVVTTNSDGTVTTNYVTTTTTTTNTTTTTTGTTTTTTASGAQTTIGPPGIVLFSASGTTAGRSLYSGILSPIGVGLKPGSLTITAGGYVFTDNGDKTLSGTAGTTGTIEYETGAWSIDLKGGDIPGQIITAAYVYYN